MNHFLAMTLLWIIRGYAIFLAAFVAGVAWIAFAGRNGGFAGAGGTVSVLSGWLLWAMLMLPVVGVACLLTGLIAWLVLRPGGLPARAAALAVGSICGVVICLLGVWFFGSGQLDPVAILGLWLVTTAAIATITLGDAQRLRARTR